MTCDSPSGLRWFIVWLPGSDLSAALTPLSWAPSPPWPLPYFLLLTLVCLAGHPGNSFKKDRLSISLQKKKTKQLFMASFEFYKWQKKMVRGVLPPTVTWKALPENRLWGRLGYIRAKVGCGMEEQWSRSWVQDAGDRVQGWNQEITQDQAPKPGCVCHLGHVVVCLGQNHKIHKNYTLW